MHEVLNVLCINHRFSQNLFFLLGMQSDLKKKVNTLMTTGNQQIRLTPQCPTLFTICIRCMCTSTIE